MYPVRDRSKPPGIMPGMISGHPALNPDGTMKERYTVELQEALIAEYRTEEFQKRLYAGWHSTEDLTERHKWRQLVCMEVQRGILPIYGFEGSRRGVYASGISCNCSCYDARAEEIGRNGNIMEWLVNPDRQESAAAPEECTMTNWLNVPTLREGAGGAEGGYEVRLTRQEDAEVLFHISQMQGVLAGAHRAMYRDLYGQLDAVQWFGVLGLNQSVHEALDRGTLVYHARARDTGVVAGYISCTCVYGDGPAPADGGDGGPPEAKPHGKIHNLVVLDHHRGHGAGKLLFNELLDHLAEACPSISSDLRINVAERNSRAREWYERLGFTAVKRWTGYPDMECPVAFITMQRSLDADDLDDLFAA